MSLKSAFAREQAAHPGRLRLTAHRQHPWPEVCFAAHQQAALERAQEQEAHREKIVRELIPRARAHLIRGLGLPADSAMQFGSSAELLMSRLLGAPSLRVLTTDAEAPDTQALLERLQVQCMAEVRNVALEPVTTFAARWDEAAQSTHWDWLVLSQVFHASGHALADLASLLRSAPPSANVLVDGRLAFMALPVQLAGVHPRLHYLASSGAYALGGEGLAVISAPASSDRIELSEYTALYRFCAAQDWLHTLDWPPARIHAHLAGLQQHLLRRLDALWLKGLNSAYLMPARSTARGGWLSFRHPQAGELWQRLTELNVVAELDGERLSFGFSLHHDMDDVEELLGRIQAVKL